MMENSQSTGKKFKRGDMVALKSGGATMMVAGYETDLSPFASLLDRDQTGLVSCVWQSYSPTKKSYTPAHATYHEDLLEITTKKPEV